MSKIFFFFYVIILKNGWRIKSALILKVIPKV